ncbi:hypothetical protein B0I37DRAFT_437687 [Chaetomium sp. MPI-CAGE-AT-0009]|nr:hypothetical protein B0I37DRAFT_437687 [Chaetomium sp. MPI-CAGE-AT-0009]
MSGHSTILSPLDAEYLRALGQLHPGPVAGFQRLHRRRMSDWCNANYGGGGLDYPLDGPDTDEIYVIIPEVLRWINRPRDGARPVVGELISERDRCDEAIALGNFFIKFIVDLTKREPYVDDEEDDAPWRAYFDSCGASQEIQDKIMDPEYKDDRLMESGWYWLKDTMEGRFIGLQTIRRTSLERAAELRRAARDSSSSPGARDGAAGGGAGTTGSGQATSTGSGQGTPAEVPSQDGQNADMGESSHPSQRGQDSSDPSQ